MDEIKDKTEADKLNEKDPANLERQLNVLTEELHEVERQRGVFIQQRDEFEAETKRLYAALDDKNAELHEVERQRGVFLQQRDEFEAETQKLYMGHAAMQEEINFWKFRHDETSALHERVVEQKWVGEHPYENYFCSFPFERIEILPQGEVYTCCSGHLKSGYSIGNIYTDDFDELWNCEKIKKLRYSVTMGDFEYCHDYCTWLANREVLGIEERIHPVRKRNEQNFFFNSWQDCMVNQTPTYIALSCDESCNLQCSSCRTHKKALNKEQSEHVYHMLMEKIRPILGNCKHLGLLGSGEVFASVACSKFLKTLTAKEFPELSIRIITNAQLFSESRWIEFKNLQGMPLLFDVSIDAATKESYEKIRLGAKWDTLCTNMELISRLRCVGSIRHLTVNFVVQKENFRQMKSFVELCKHWTADTVFFQKMTNWGTSTDQEYIDKNVFDSKNKNFQEAVTILRQVTENSLNIKIIENISEHISSQL